MKQVLDIRPGRGAPEEIFTCEHCGREVTATAPGARLRTHCPYCLWSLHGVDGQGGHGADCRGQMQPVAVRTQAGGEWSLVHRCRQCQVTQVNAIAVDDDVTALLALASRLGRAGSARLVR